MSHRVHPKAYRIRRIEDWDSRGFYKDHQEYLEEDFRIREFLMKRLEKVGVEKIEIERFSNKINIIISSARPGLIIGRGGEGIDKLRKELDKSLKQKSIVKLYKTFEKVNYKKNNKISSASKKNSLKETDNSIKNVKIEIREIKNPWASANLSGQWAARQIEKRIPYRRVLKQGLEKILESKEIKGAKIEFSGRLNGTEIARREWAKDGRLPLQSLRANIDYARVNAYCTYGVIGIKVWIYKGDKFD
ncbi:MAG: 30S ribosomal protein S3 [Patescibacteria group bacterium]|nr:30S ribosomal protein S3 [Patescibacteria group bacterium]